MPLVDITIELQDGGEMDVSVPDDWSDSQISEWASTQLSQGLKEPEQLPAAGRMEAAGLGLMREGRGFGSTLEQVAQTGSRFATGQAGATPEVDIPAREAAAEAEFSERTREHPVFAGIGRAGAYLPFGGGSSAAGGLLRGALGGALAYSDDPSTKALMTVGGGAAGRLGVNVLGKAADKAGINTLGARANQLGLNVPPEIRGPVLFPNAVKDTLRFEGQMGNFSKQHRREITSQILTDLNQSGNRITSETFSVAKNNASELFNKATSSRGLVPLFGFRKKIDSFISSEESRRLNDPPTLKLLKDWREKLSDPKKSDMLTSKEYQELRSQMGKKAESFPKRKAEKRAAVYGLIEQLDNAAAATLPANAKKDFREARSLWRNIQLYKNPSFYDDNGLVNARSFRNNLVRKDENKFLYDQGQKGRLSDLLDLEFDLPSGGNAPGFGVAASMSSSGPHTFLTGLKSLAEVPIVGAARIPTRAIESAPLGMSVPQIRSLLGPSNAVDLNLDSLENQ